MKNQSKSTGFAIFFFLHFPPLATNEWNDRWRKNPTLLRETYISRPFVSRSIFFIRIFFPPFSHQNTSSTPPIEKSPLLSRKKGFFFSPNPVTGSASYGARRGTQERRGDGHSMNEWISEWVCKFVCVCVCASDTFQRKSFSRILPKEMQWWTKKSRKWGIR